MILLASAASVGGPGVLALDTTKIIGDVPGLAEIFIAPTSATGYGASMTTESVYWSLGARPSFQAFWPAGSAVALASDFSRKIVPALVGDQYAPGSQSLRYPVGSNFWAAFVGWWPFAAWTVPPSLEPAYRGRFRAFAWAKLTPSQANPWRVSLDVQQGTYVSDLAFFTGPAMASAAQVATLPVAAATDLGGASPAYSMIDLGEVTLPAVASQSVDTQIRLWFSPTLNVPTPVLDVGGLYLQPLDNAGVLPRGIAQPTITSIRWGTRFYISAVTRDAYVVMPTSVVGSLSPVANAQQHYRGVLPQVGASSLQLDLNLAGYHTGNYAVSDISQPRYPPVRSEPHFAQVSVRYRPRFTFLKGL
jgi:hypothetical protein